MVTFGRKNKTEDRRLLASTDEMNNGKIHLAENGNNN